MVKDSKLPLTPRAKPYAVGVFYLDRRSFLCFDREEGMPPPIYIDGMGSACSNRDGPQQGTTASFAGMCHTATHYICIYRVRRLTRSQTVF